MNFIGHNIEAIIFDFGGVILNIDYHKTVEAFESLGVKEFDKQYSQVAQTDLFNLLELGKITEQEFCASLKDHLGLKLSDEEIILAWNALLGTYRLGSLDFVRRLNQKFPIYLLSNTNAIHQKEFEKELVSNTTESSLKDLFQNVYYSHQIEMRKPHPETFIWVCQQNLLNPSTTLFIDDSIQHVEGAQKAGLIAHHLQPEERVEVLLSNFLT